MSLADNRIQLQDCENNGEVSSDTSAAPTADVNDAGAVIEGSRSIAFQVDDAQEAILFYQDAAGTPADINFDASDVTIYMNVKHNICESFGNLGAQIVLGDGVQATPGDVIGYNVAGNDVAGFPYLFRYTTIKLDVSVIVAVPGSNDVDYYQYFGTEAGLNHAIIRQIGYGSFSVEKAVSTGKNAWIDGIYYIANSISSTTGYAVSIEGGTSGTPETMVDVAADDVAVGMGLFNNPKGSEYGFFGPTEWGNDGAADSYFDDADGQWFFIGDNNGGHIVASPHFPFRMVGNSTSVNSFVATRITIVNTGVRAEFDWTNADMDIIKWDTCTFVDLGVISCPVQDAGNKFANNCVFINCAQMDWSSMDMDGNTVIGSTNVLGTILWDENTDESNQDNITFTSTGTGHAIHVFPVGAGPFTFNIDGYSVSGYETLDDTGTGNTVFLIDSALDADITINVSNGTGTFSFEKASGYTGAVVIDATVTTTLTGLVNNTEVSVYDTGDGSEIAHVENVVGNEFAFSDAASNVVDIFIHHVEYFRADILGFTIPGANTSVPVSQLFDPNYVNL